MSFWVIRIFFLLLCVTAGYAVSQYRPEIIEGGIYGVTIGWVSTRNRIDTRLLWVVIIGNLVWAIDTALLGVSGWISPQTLGLVLLLAQALAVAVFAELQYLGLRQSRALAGS